MGQVLQHSPLEAYPGCLVNLCAGHDLKLGNMGDRCGNQGPRRSAWGELSGLYELLGELCEVLRLRSSCNFSKLNCR